MTIQDFRDTFISTLSGVYAPEEVHSLLYITLEHYLGLSRVEVTLSRKQTLKDTQQLILEETLTRLQRQEPIQYILGKTEFCDLDFIVNEATLIPRPETEELVRWILDVTKKEVPKKLLDIGTGSGCIAISLAKDLHETAVTAYDISKDAIRVATENAHRNAVDVQFDIVDILSQSELTENFDVIVSNPPYVRNLEKEEMASNVLEFEPHSALFVSDQDPLVFYRKIAGLAFKYLNVKGSLFLEINQYLGKETVELLNEVGFTSVELREDMFGEDRMIRANKD